MTRITKEATRLITGRRTIRIPDRFQNRPVRSRRGLAQPRRPANVSSAGRNVSAPAQPTMMAAARATPTVEKTVSFVKIMPRNVTATVAADAVMTLPIEASALRTASSDSAPIRRKS